MDYSEQIIMKANDLQDMMKTRGWSEIVYPLLQNMIFDITGGEKNGVFISGQLSKGISKEELFRLIGMKDGLIGFWNNLTRIIYEADQIEKGLNKNKKED